MFLSDSSVNYTLVANYPFDEQACHMKFGSWTYNGEELNVTSFTNHIILDNLSPNGEWKVSSQRPERCCLREPSRVLLGQLGCGGGITQGMLNHWLFFQISAKRN